MVGGTSRRAPGGSGERRDKLMHRAGVADDVTLARTGLLGQHGVSIGILAQRARILEERLRLGKQPRGLKRRRPAHVHHDRHQRVAGPERDRT
jgi:hypothetical protein